MKDKQSEAGYTATGVLVSLSLASGFTMIVSKQSKQMEQLSRPIVYAAKVMDLQHYVHENFSCEKTDEQVDCNDTAQFLNTYTKHGDLLTSAAGSEFSDIPLKAECAHDEYSFVYKAPDGQWTSLYDKIPIVCRTESEPTCDGADVLNFEELPDGSSLTEGMQITNQFLASHGVSFSRKNGDPLYVGEVEGDHYSWGCQTCKKGKSITNGVRKDKDQPIGDFFLTDESGYGNGNLGDLVIDYETPVTEASAVIMDIDWDEEWEITAYNEKGEPIDTITLSGQGYKYDGRPMLWKFENLPEGETIKQIVLEGADNAGFGLGFDNFSPSKACDTVTL